MTLDQVRRLYDAKPFFPFTIHVTDGRKFSVPSREFLFLPPGGRILVVVTHDAVDILDLLLVTGLEVKTTAPPMDSDANGEPGAL